MRLRFLKIALLVLCTLSLAGTIFQLYSIPSEALWPINVVVRELWPLLLILNLTALIVAIFRWRWLALVFALGMIVAAWPLTQLSTVTSSMTQQWNAAMLAPSHLRTPTYAGIMGPSLTGWSALELQPEKLPLAIHQYRAHENANALAPVLIHIHGGSWQHGSPIDNALFCSYFAERGWAVFSLSYRLAPAAKYPAQIDDVRASIDWIYTHAKQLHIDTSRIVLAGHSAGGHLAMLAAFTGSSVPIRGIVSFYGPGDLQALYEHPPKPDPINVRAKLEAFLGGSPTTAPAAYHEVSPASYLKSQLPPTLLIQGGRDNVVEIELTRELNRQLRVSGNRSLLLDIPWADHSFDFVYFGPGNAIALHYIESFVNEVTATPLQTSDPDRL